jgi:hypothetical protein
MPGGVGGEGREAFPYPDYKGINIYKICYSNSAIRSRDKNPF